ncbi:hypothetical protein LOTGIDRAFT_203651 [Lottia gigantea]|uniref:Polysaccharide lyase 14 domain-containing protein n=1 Tax=Lottia gigantea TaxID=225164 RepID=V4CC14_LOTGI|nr:hypothetical protein LOTGIDRAFT_203651 [Lottia gigantea]ESO99399.1 hypothetical protein LOTGIDRAFT_203651 [Lottia gigantea]
MFGFSNLCWWWILNFLLHCETRNERADKIVWKNNDFPRSNPLKNFHKLKGGYFNHGSLTIDKDPAGGDQDVMKVFYKNGTFSLPAVHTLRGAQFYCSPIPPQTSMTLSYQVYFNPGFDFVMGGKLPGLFGGAHATCSGGRHSTTCFSARLMWRENGDGEIYTYIPDQSASFCNRTDVECLPIKGTSLGRGSWRFKTGEWVKITEHISLNNVGKDDGLAQIWINGKLVYTAKNIIWRVNENIKIEGLFFSTFFGGASQPWAAHKDEYSYFKDFVLTEGESVPVVGK